MGLKDLGQLFIKRNIVFAILVAWLLFGFVALYFSLAFQGLILSRVLFFPLLTICLVLFLYTAVFRGDVRHMTWKNLGKAGSFMGIAIIAYFLIGIYLFTTMIDLFTSLMFVISIFSYIFITVIFAMYFCFEKGVKFDDSVYKAPTAISFPVRWGIFLFGFLISIILVLYGPSRIAGEAPLVPKTIESKELAFTLTIVPIVTILMIFAFVIIAILVLIIKKKFNAWLGVFFVFIGSYISFLMISALFTVKGGQTLPILIARILMFSFDLLILLISIGSLIGKRADLISKKLKFISSDTILIWLIFSKAAYIYSDNILPSGDLTMMKGVAIFYLVIPLMVAMGLYGIIKYGEIKQVRKKEKTRKLRIKKSKKQVDQIKKDRAKTEEEKRRKAEEKARKKAKERAKKK